MKWTTLILLCFLGVLNLSISEAAAPPFSPTGSPYTEAICTDDPNVIFCESFDNPHAFQCTTPCSSGACSFTWDNSGLPPGSEFSKTRPGLEDCKNAYYVPISDPRVPAKPAGWPVSSGDHVKLTAYDRPEPGFGSHNGSTRGCLWSDCSRSTYESPVGAKYVNGQEVAFRGNANETLHVRYAYYWSTNMTFPLTSDKKIFFLQPQRYLDNPSANAQIGHSFQQSSGYCNSGGTAHGGRTDHEDMFSFLVNGAGFNQYPGKINSTWGSPSPFFHDEYCRGQGKPAIQAGLPPSEMLHTHEKVNGTCPGNFMGCHADKPRPGRVTRFQKGKWYSIEWAVKHSEQGKFNGRIQMWIDGVLIYDDNDINTCGNHPVTTHGDCVVTDFFFDGYLGAKEPTGPNGAYSLIDHLVFSTSYIGPPGAGSSGGGSGGTSTGGGGTGSTPPPTNSQPDPPSNLQIRLN